MNSPLRNPSSHSGPASVNPFARAMAEARGGQGQGDNVPTSSPKGSPFDAMNSLNSADNQQSQLSGAALAEQQRLQEERQRRERLRQKLHREVNPVESQDVFSAQEQRIKKELNDIRHELKMLLTEVQEMGQEAELSVMANVASPGIEAKYYFSFFQKLREWIMLLRQQVHSAHTWATTLQSKKKKKGKMGMEISGQQYEQTTTIFDRMHHERSTVYSGS